MNLLDWFYPPVAERRALEKPDPPCDMCGVEAGSCTCPECPICFVAGNRECRERCWPELVERYNELCDQLNNTEQAIEEAAVEADVQEHGVIVPLARWHAIEQSIVG